MGAIVAKAMSTATPDSKGHALWRSSNGWALFFLFLDVKYHTTGFSPVFGLRPNTAVAQWHERFR
jgi:hypothetical protein